MDGEYSMLKNINLPLYLQVKNYIEVKIREKEFLPGQKLPTERDLAKAMSVSRNTVSEAYKELVLEGVLVSKTGKGTFLADEHMPSNSGKTRMDKLSNILAEALDKAVKIGFTAQDFLNVAQIKVREFELKNSQKVILVLDKSADLAYCYAKQIEQILGCRVESNRLKTLANMPESLLKHYTNIVIPRVFSREVKTNYPSIAGKELIKYVDCQLCLADALQIARVESSRKIYAISDDKDFEEVVQEVFKSIGFGERNFVFRNIKALNKINPNALYVVSARLENDFKRQYADAQVVVLRKEIDQGSLQTILNDF